MANFLPLHAATYSWPKSPQPDSSVYGTDIWPGSGIARADCWAMPEPLPRHDMRTWHGLAFSTDPLLHIATAACSASSPPPRPPRLLPSSPSTSPPPLQDPSPLRHELTGFRAGYVPCPLTRGFTMGARTASSPLHQREGQRRQ